MVFNERANQAIQNIVVQSFTILEKLTQRAHAFWRGVLCCPCSTSLKDLRWLTDLWSNLEANRSRRNESETRQSPPVPHRASQTPWSNQPESKKRQVWNEEMRSDMETSDKTNTKTRTQAPQMASIIADVEGGQDRWTAICSEEHTGALRNQAFVILSKKYKGASAHGLLLSSSADKHQFNWS